MLIGDRVHPETPDGTPAVSDLERRHNLVIPLTGFSRNVFALARKSRSPLKGCRGDFSAEAHIICSFLSPALAGRGTAPEWKATLSGWK